MHSNNNLPHLRMIQWNARGLYRAKLEEFKNNLRSVNPALVCLSETHWLDSHPVSFSAYNSFILNRPSQSGGVAILTKKNLSVAPLVLPPPFPH